MRQLLSRVGTGLVILSGFLVALTVIGDVMLGFEVPQAQAPFMILASLAFIIGGTACFNAQVQDRSLLITAGLVVIAISLYLVEPFILSLFTLASGAVVMSAGFVGRHQPPETPFAFDLSNDWHFRNAKGNENRGSLQAATFADDNLVVYLLMWNKSDRYVDDAFHRIRQEVMEPRTENISCGSAEIYGHDAVSFSGTSTDGHYFEVYKYHCKPSEMNILLQITSQGGEAAVREGQEKVICHGSIDDSGEKQRQD